MRDGSRPRVVKYYINHWMLIVSIVLISAGLTYAYLSLFSKPLYKSEAALVITNKNETKVILASNYVELFKSRRVLDAPLKKHDYNGGYDSLIANTSVVNVKGTDVLRISISSGSPDRSRDLLNSAIESFTAEATNVYKAGSVIVIDQASLPSGAYNINTVKHVGLAAAISFAATIAVIFFVYDYKYGQDDDVPPAKPGAGAKLASSSKPLDEEKLTHVSDSETEVAVVEFHSNRPLIVASRSLQPLHRRFNTHSESARQ